MALNHQHPCLSCGACCAYFRVVFYWREASDETKNGTPIELTKDYDSFRRVMKGTETKLSMGCVALKGRVGEKVGCSIYEKRPSVCRKFSASYEDGKQNKRCDEARASHGLKPLKKSDWIRAPEKTESL